MAKKKADDHERLQALIEDATIDCYGEYEEHTGLVCMIEEHVVCPFKAKVVGEEVEVVELRMPDSGFGLDAICRSKNKDYRVDVSSLEWPKKKPKGYEWLEAFQLWRSTLS